MNAVVLDVQFMFVNYSDTSGIWINWVGSGHNCQDCGKGEGGTLAKGGYP